jgi:5-methylcytosine-specific restriction protein B
MNERLQLYYDYFVQYYAPETWEWHRGLTEALAVVQSLKGLLAGPTPPSVANALQQASGNTLHSIDDFLQEYLFDRSNKLGSIGRGIIYNNDDNPHRDAIRSRITGDFLAQLLTLDKETADAALQTAMEADRRYPASRNRLLRALFPEEMVAVDAPGKLNRLIEILRQKLGIRISGTPLEKHAALMNAIDGPYPLKQIFYWELYDMLDNKLSLKKAVVYYGAPGTGKTFRARNKAEEIIREFRLKLGRPIDAAFHIKTVQFHPSYAYEDFIEGIRPSNERELKVFNGTFKQFCKEAGAREIALYRSAGFLSNPAFKKCQFDFSQITLADLNDEQRGLLGVGPDITQPGLTLLEVIEPAFFLIDEINRAELSRVFGELMFSLEYRGYTGKIKTQYAYLSTGPDAPNVFYWENGENWFFVPQNIYVIGTMNNIDRSVDSFDFALRRRFMWEEIEPEYDIIREELPRWGQALADSLEKLNIQISEEKLLGKDYRIGHAYILNIKSIENRFDGIMEARRFLWEEFIHALLGEYLRGLGDEQQTIEKIELFKTTFGVKE